MRQRPPPAGQGQDACWQETTQHEQLPPPHQTVSRRLHHAGRLVDGSGPTPARPEGPAAASATAAASGTLGVSMPYRLFLAGEGSLLSPAGPWAAGRGGAMCRAGRRHSSGLRLVREMLQGARMLWYAIKRRGGVGDASWEWKIMVGARGVARQPSGLQCGEM